MAALLVPDSEVATCFAPFDAVGQDATTSGAKPRQEMRQLVSQSAIHFAGMIAQSRVQRDQFGAKIGTAGTGSQTRVPFDADFVREAAGAVRSQMFAGELL